MSQSEENASYSNEWKAPSAADVESKTLSFVTASSASASSAASLSEEVSEVSRPDSSNGLHLLEAWQAHLVVDYVRKGANLNQINDFGLAPLHVHCFQGNVEVARALLLAKASLTRRDGFNWFLPLHLAVSAKQSGVVQLLCEEFGQNSNARFPDGGLPTTAAGFLADVPTLRVLLLNGAHLEPVLVRLLRALNPLLSRWLQVTEGWSKMQFACEGRRCEMVTRLLRTDDSPVLLGPSGTAGWTALDAASGHNGTMILPFALEPSQPLINMLKRRTEPYDPRFHYLFPEQYRRGACQVMSIRDQLGSDDCRAIVHLDWDLWLHVMSFTAPNWFTQEDRMVT